MPACTIPSRRPALAAGALLTALLTGPVAALLAGPALATPTSPPPTAAASTSATASTAAASTAPTTAPTTAAATTTATVTTTATATSGSATTAAPGTASIGVRPLATGSAADRAAAYLVKNLADGDHVVGPFGPDLGQTADVVLALSSVSSQNAARDAAAAYLAAHTDDYVHGAAFADGSAGSEKKGANYAGPTGKAIVAALAAGQDPRALGGFDLVSELTDLMVTSGAEAGRFSDDSAFGDYSNPLGQAFDIIALTRATGDVPDAAVRFLLTAQCADGGFDDAYPASARDCSSNPDATGLALQALVAAGVTDATSDSSCAAGAALAWLRAHDARDGSYASGAVNPSAPSAANVNSTAYAALGLTAAKAGTTAQIAYLTKVQNADGGLPIVPASKDTTSNVLATAQALGALTRTTYLSLGSSPLPAATPACSPTPSTTSRPTTSAATAAATLPETGTDPLVPGLAGLALVLLGTGAVLVARRPRGARQR
jgi:LPXTG-motif cell wall-anchored protein